jgi:hypothetical protein
MFWADVFFYFPMMHQFMVILGPVFKMEVYSIVKIKSDAAIDYDKISSKDGVRSEVIRGLSILLL